MNEIKEPILACPNDPDDVKLLSQVAGDKIDEVFIGSCMTNIGHFRAAGKVLQGRRESRRVCGSRPRPRWTRPILTQEGYYATSGRRRAHRDARLLAVHGKPGADPQRFDRHLDVDPQLPEPPGHRTRVYLGSAELAAVCALLGRIPTVAEYMQHIEAVNKHAGDVYRYMNFDQIDEYRSAATKTAA